MPSETASSFISIDKYLYILESIDLLELDTDDDGEVDEHKMNPCSVREVKRI